MLMLLDADRSKLILLSYHKMLTINPKVFEIAAADQAMQKLGQAQGRKR